MDPTEAAAKAAYETMMNRPWQRAEIRDEIRRGVHDWDKQPQGLRDDWIATIQAAVGAERERLRPTFTTRPPTEPGFYWWRLRAGTDVQVFELNVIDGKLWAFGNHPMNSGDPVTFGGEWAGPLVPPA